MAEDGWEWRMAHRERPLPPDEPAPDDGTCLECFAWKRYSGVQAHLGFTWWRTCPWDCPHAHHDAEVWMASDG